MLLGRPWLKAVKALGVYENDEYWIQASNGDLVQLTSPSALPPRVRLDRNVNQAELPYDPQTFAELRATRKWTVNEALELALQNVIDEADESDLESEGRGLQIRLVVSQS